MTENEVKKIKEEIIKDVEKTISRYINIGGGSHRIGNKRFNIEVTSRMEKQFSHLVFKKNRYVSFKTKSYGEIICGEGIVINSYWKDIHNLITLHDVKMENGKIMRVITDPERYPDDQISAID